MNKFTTGAKNQTSWKFTENGQPAYSNTGSKLLNFFATVGALRTRTDTEVLQSFYEAFDENPLYAVRALFYARNIRGGLGERRVFKTILKWLATYSDFTRQIVKLNIYNVATFGRFDDFYALVDTPLESFMFDILGRFVERDLKGMESRRTISLVAKWLKSVNSSSDETNRLGKLTAKYFGLSERQYRKMVSSMRSYIDIVEKNMSQGNWEEIVYEHVPSNAMKNYRKAFGKHDFERFSQYIEDVKSGEKKINSGTLYPYNIFQGMELDVEHPGWYSKSKDSHFTFLKWDEILQAQWDNLPNYVSGENNVMVMADTSASMSGLPMSIALSLATYFAERNHGAYANLFMTFDNHPAFVLLEGENLKEKIKCIHPIVANTNLEAAFDLLLQTAIKTSSPQEDMPKALIVISDMEFDVATTNTSDWLYNKYESYGLRDFHELMERKYNQAGYVMPTIVYWNVDARQDTFHVDATRKNTILVSGSSTSTFKNVLDNIGVTPYEAMIKILNDETYSVIRMPEQK